MFMHNENSFARAFGGDGGTCEAEGGPGLIPLSLFSQEKIFGTFRLLS